MYNLGITILKSIREFLRGDRQLAIEQRVVLNSNHPNRERVEKFDWIIVAEHRLKEGDVIKFSSETVNYSHRNRLFKIVKVYNTFHETDNYDDYFAYVVDRPTPDEFKEVDNWV